LKELRKKKTSAFADVFFCAQAQNEISCLQQHAPGTAEYA
jgi:hypothetical protein